jgi:hypothetical protein
MSAHEEPEPTGDRSPRRSLERRAAVRRLEAALIEQARLQDGLHRSVGTSSEQATYSRMRAASARVSECDRAVRALSGA